MDDETGPTTGTRGRPHPAGVVESRVRGAVVAGLRTRGWVSHVVPFTGYAADGWVRVFARVVVLPPGSPALLRDDRPGWRRFVSPSAGEGVPVTVEVGGRREVVTTGRDGHVDVRLAADLSPGWATARLSVEGAEPVQAPVRVVGPETVLGLVSDIDDTVMHTMLPRPLVAFRNAFLVKENARRPVRGMGALYREIVDEHPDVFVVYLSTGAWNAGVALTMFLARHRYPPGPLLLTDWGPTHDGWFRSGPEHKRRELARLFDDFPGMRWLLVGDDGQHDPSLYDEARRSAPDRVLGVAIRQLTLTEQVVRYGAPGPSDALTLTGNELPGDPVRAPDGFGLRKELVRRRVVLGAGRD